MDLKIIANIQAEQEVLGSILVNQDKILDALDILDSSDFYKESHQMLYTVMVMLFKADKPIDVTFIAENIDIAKIGGISYLADLAAAGGSNVTTEHFKIIKEKANLRKLQSLLYKALEKVKDNNFEDVLNTIQTNLLSLNESKKEEYISDAEMMNSTIEVIENVCKNSKKLLGIESGIKTLDLAINGFQDKLYVIAGRPAMGKSALALNIAHNVSKSKYVDYYSLEMGEDEIGIRRIGMETLLDTTRINYGKLDSNEWERVARATNHIASGNCSTCCEPKVHINKIIAESKKKKAQGKLDMIIVDHIGYMDMKGMGDSLREQTSNLCVEFKILSKELGIPVIILSQINRGVEGRMDKRPLLSDLKESGGIEENADVVVFVYRDQYYFQDTDKKDIIEAIIAKQRNGRTGTIELAWRGTSQKISDLDYYRQNS